MRLIKFQANIKEKEIQKYIGNKHIANKIKINNIVKKDHKDKKD